MKIAFKYGVVIGLGLAGWDILTNEYLYNTLLGRAPFIFQLVILLTGLFVGIWDYKKSVFGNKITFGNASVSGIKIAVVAALVFSMASFLYYQKAAYRFDEYSIRETLRVAKEKNATPKDMKQINEMVAMTKAAENPANKAKGAMLVTSILGLLFSLIFAAILRNAEPKPLE